MNTHVGRNTERVMFCNVSYFFDRLCLLSSWNLVVIADFDDQRVFFIEYDTSDLKSAMYNGSDVKTVISTNVKSNNQGMDIGSDYVFYISNKKILKVLKSSGQIPTTVHTDASQLYGLLFYKQDGKNILTYINIYMNKN